MPLRPNECSACNPLLSRGVLASSVFGHHEFGAMKTPGFGLFSAVALSSRIAGIERLKRPRSLSNYFGLTPGSRNSGEKERLGHITKAGSSMARWVLGQASKHILRTDPAMRAWFKKIKRKKGGGVARVAVMRRMAMILWHMLTKRKTYAEVRNLSI